MKQMRKTHLESASPTCARHEFRVSAIVAEVARC